MSTRDILAANLLTLKKHFGLSNLKFAKFCGVSNGTIDRAIHSKVALDLDTLSAIAAACQVQVWQLLTPNLDPLNPPVVTQLTETERKLYEKLARAIGTDRASSD